MPLHSLTDWANQHSRIASIVLIAIILGVAAWLAFERIGPPATRPKGEAWYFDPVTETYFAGSALDVAPIQSPDGNPAYRAYFYDCGGCSGNTEPETAPAGFLGYYETYTEQGAEQVRQLRRTIAAARGATEPAVIIAAQNAESRLMTYTMKYKLVSRDGENWEQTDASRGQPAFFESEIRERCRGKSELVNCGP